MKMLATLATALVVSVLAVAQAPAKGGYDRECGDQSPPPPGVPYTDLKADNVSCGAAHKVAERYVSGEFENGYRGWTCVDKVLGPEELKVKCTRDKNGGQRAKFYYGA